MNCSGAEGTCEKQAAKAGLCWGHYERKLKRSIFGPGKLAQKAIAEPLTGYAADPLDGLYRAILRFRDELETETDEDFKRGKERVRTALRRYLWSYMPKTLKRWRWTPTARVEVDEFLANYGDKAKHAPPKRTTQHQPRRSK